MFKGTHCDLRLIGECRKCPSLVREGSIAWLWPENGMVVETWNCNLVTDFPISWIEKLRCKLQHSHRNAVGVFSTRLFSCVFSGKPSTNLCEPRETKVGGQLGSRGVLPRDKCGCEEFSLASGNRRFLRWDFLRARHATFKIPWLKCYSAWIHVAWSWAEQRKIQRDLYAGHAKDCHAVWKIRHLCPARHASRCLL